MNYPLALNSWGPEELECFNKLIATGRFTMGEFTTQFEDEFARWQGSRHAVMVNSGSSANLLAVAALFYTRNNPLQRGDTVIVPAVSWSTTYSPLHQYGLKLKFVDVDLNTLNYDLNALGEAIDDKVRLIVAVNLLGNPNDFETISKLVGDRPIQIIEDNCESLGAVFNGKKTGTHGIIGTFSSYFSHHISTIEGGMVCTDNDELNDIILCLRAHGWTRNLDDDNKLVSKSTDSFYESFRFILPGYNLRPMELSAAIGIHQLHKLDDFITQRQNNHTIFNRLFETNNDFILQQEIGQSSWFGFSLLVHPESRLKRSTIVRQLRSNNIECRPVVTGNFTRNEVIKYFDHEIHGDLRNADIVHEQGFFVGNHHIPMQDMLQHLSEVLNSI